MAHISASGDPSTESGPDLSGEKDTYRVLILSAGVGAGHDGAARELAKRLEARGHHVEIKDYLLAWPLRLGIAFRHTYEGMLAHAPWSYEALYRSWYVFPFLRNILVFNQVQMTTPTLRRWFKSFNPDVVVSTYPISSLVLGHMRLKGKLAVPAITYVTDFHVHKLLTHEGVDLHLCVHENSTKSAAAQVSGAVKSCGPLVSDRFHDISARRHEKRVELDVVDASVALVCAGSWGAGEVDATVNDMLGVDGLVPVVVCGRNEALRARLSANPRVRAVGWTTDMVGLMAAADVLIDNAGGLTAMEALSAGLPVINYRPLVGHGRDNATDMEAAGVVKVAHDLDQLRAVFDELTTNSDQRAMQVSNGKAMFKADATDDVLHYASGEGTPLAPVISIGRGRRREGYKPRRKRKFLGGIAIATTVISMGLTTGVGEATAHGLGGAHPGRDDTTTYVGVRVDSDELSDPDVRAMLTQLPMTTVLDSQTAVAHRAEVHSLVHSGVEIANGGSGEHDPGWMPWSRAHEDISKATVQLNESTGMPVRLFLPSRRLDSFDLLLSKRAHEKALPTAEAIKRGDPISELKDPGVYVIDGRNESTAELLDSLHQMRELLTDTHLPAAPLAHLV